MKSRQIALPHSGTSTRHPDGSRGPALGAADIKLDSGFRRDDEGLRGAIEFGSGDLEPPLQVLIKYTREGAGDEPFARVVGNKENFGRLERSYQEGVAPDGRIDRTSSKFDKPCRMAMDVKDMR